MNPPHADGKKDTIIKHIIKEIIKGMKIRLFYICYVFWNFTCEIQSKHSTL